MNEVVTKITETVKEINTGNNPLKTENIGAPRFKPPVANSNGISTKSNGWDMMTFVKIFLIIVLLAILGINIFVYLARGTEWFKQFLIDYGKFIPSGIKRTLNLSEEGTKLALDVAAGSIKDVKDIIDKETGLHANMWKKRDKNLEKAINRGSFRGINNFPQHEPDRSDGRIQEKKRKGYCYVGTDRTFRSCIKVGKNDTCMSGKIFPTRDICINPSLRE